MGRNYYNELQERRKRRRVIEELEEITYTEYLTNNQINGEEANTCIICAFDLKPNDKVIVLKCHYQHVFHSNCIKSWLEVKAICPVCRYDLLNDRANNN